jgi:hypothetical protein
MAYAFTLPDGGVMCLLLLILGLVYVYWHRGATDSWFQ